MADYQKVTHTFPPVWDADSRILILGSFPSVKSREQQFYYGHPQNRFWKVLSALYDCPLPLTTSEKEEFLLQNGIALWDVIAVCEIIGSSDSTIRNVTPNDLHIILDHARIRQIYTNGAAAHRLYEHYCQPSCRRSAVRLPSTSPANAAWSLPRLIDAWGCLRFPCPSSQSHGSQTE